MADWKKVYRCKQCGSIYPYDIDIVCDECGAEIGKRVPNFPYIPGATITFSSIDAITEIVPTENCEIVTARKRFFRPWEIKED